MRRFARSELLLGKENMRKLEGSHIAVFGVGGVGSYAVEALARSGVGKLSLFDSDTVSLTNINRQLIALDSTVGMPKVSVCAQRCRDINPEIIVHEHQIFFTTENAHEIDFASFDYVIDAIDTVSAKIELARICDALSVPLISSMGTGNKIDPTKLKISDISKTSVCPLARVMRKELRERGIKKLKVLYSEEVPIKPCYDENSEKKGNLGRLAPASFATVPSCAGLIIANEVMLDICHKK